jgi:hypothetical protein
VTSEGGLLSPICRTAQHGRLWFPRPRFDPKDGGHVAKDGCGDAGSEGPVRRNLEGRPGALDLTVPKVRKYAGVALQDGTRLSGYVFIEANARVQDMLDAGAPRSSRSSTSTAMSFS